MIRRPPRSTLSSSSAASDVYKRQEEGAIKVEVNTFPDSCPICHIGMDPRYFTGYLSKGEFLLELIFQCPLSDCRHLFIGYYRSSRQFGDPRYEYLLSRSEPNLFEPREFSETINSVSKNFVKIYNQSEQAEKLELEEIAGI